MEKTIYVNNNNNELLAKNEPENNRPKFSVFASSNCTVQITEIQSGPIKKYTAYAVSKGEAFIALVTGQTEEKIINMLFSAVNNRTIERNYFKLYCEMLEGSITEDEFDIEVTENESNYIVNESLSPSAEIAELALNLGLHIKDVETVNDLSALFSFNPDELNKLIKCIHG